MGVLQRRCGLAKQLEVRENSEKAEIVKAFSSV